MYNMLCAMNKHTCAVRHSVRVCFALRMSNVLLSGTFDRPRERGKCSASQI